MKGKGYVDRPIVEEASVVTLEWPDGRRVVMDILQSPIRCTGRLGRLIHTFGVKVEVTGLRRKWDKNYLVPLSEPYSPPRKKW